MTEALTEQAIKPPHSGEDRAQANQQTRSTIIAEGFRSHTRGERLFNQLTYTGVGFFGVTAVSVLLTWILRDHPRTSPHYEQFVQKISARFPKFEQAINSNATIATLFAGGTLVSVLPVKWLEDNKARLVKKFDRMYYGEDGVANNPDVVAAHEAMESMPKQTWGSVFFSRIFAFAATLGTSLLLGSNKSPLARATGESIDRRSTELGRWLDKRLGKNTPAIVQEVEAATAANKAMTDRGTEILRTGAHPDRVRSRILSYIGLDGFYTVITSVTLYAFTRILAPILGKKQAASHTAASTEPTVPSSLQTTATALDKTAEMPSAQVSETTHQQRVSEPVSHHLSA